MSKILGLDLGTNSIGWALIEDEKGKEKILGTGVRIFPTGVENLGEGENEISKNATRRDARQIRRQLFRKKLRKQLLLQVLAKNAMVPLNQEQIKEWKKTGKFPNTPEFLEWIKLNPYELRHKGLWEPLSLFELGRVCYHISQRRGFLSNSRNAAKDEGKIFDGDKKVGKTGINETLEKIEGQTLGEYLHSIYPAAGKSYQEEKERIRNRYTTRQMYVEEFEELWEAQTKLNENLSFELREQLGGRRGEVSKNGNEYGNDGILFYQRPLRTQKFLIGNCSFEKNKPRCPISAIPFELYRAYQFINGIECNGQKLDDEEREIVLRVLLRAEKPTFAKVKKALKKEGDDFSFNYMDDDSCPGSWTIYKLSSKNYFGKQWDVLTDQEKEEIWHVLFFFDDRKKLRKYALTKWSKWGIDEQKAEALSKFQLKKGYAALSRKAISNILPFLEMGFTYDIATTLGGIKNAFCEAWATLSLSKKDFIITNVPAIVQTKTTGGYIQNLKEFLGTECNFSDTQFKKLYHHSSNIHKGAVLDTLPVGKEADKEIVGIRNPIVIKALFELRKVVNALLEEYGPLDQIKIELARDLKISKTQRNKVRSEMRAMERYHDDIIGRLREHGQAINHPNILKYKLWEECEHKCPFSERAISIEQLFNEDGEVQIEHIFPWDRSLDNSYVNKTLCFADINRRKGNRTPYEYFTQDFGPKKWEEVKERWLKTFYDTKQFPKRYKKFKRLVSEKFEENFAQRQLNDTRYISREASAYLQKICLNVNVLSGGVTANLRNKWGLNSILSEAEEKERIDHRHHAIDALVVACCKIAYLNEVAKWNRYDRTYDLKDFPMPWLSYRAAAEKSIHGILVSYSQSNKVLTTRMVKTKKNGKVFVNKGISARGQLHKESVYGKRTIPDGVQSFHIRKPLENITTATHVSKIVDNKIRQLIEKRIAEMGGYEGGKNIPKGAFFTTNEKGERIALIKLPNKNGTEVPVYRVRWSETINGAQQLSGTVKNSWVNPMKNHHVLIFTDAEGNKKADVVSLWVAVERKRQGLHVIQLPEKYKDGNIYTTLQIHDMFLLGLEEDEINWSAPNMNILSQHLYKVQKAAGGSYFLELCFRKHTDARLDKDAKKEYKYIKNFGNGKTGWLTHNPIKVELSVTGKLTKAHAKTLTFL